MEPKETAGQGGGEWLALWKEILATMRHPPRPPAIWVGLSIAILVIGCTLLAVLLALGYVHHEWPAYYLDDDQPGTWLTVGVLWTSATILILKSLRLGGWMGEGRLWLLMGVTLLLAALDDLLRWHERIDLWLHALFDADPRHPVTDRIDDTIVACYGVLALWYLWRNRDQLLELPWMMISFTIGGGLFALMVVFDAGHLSQSIEDSLKTVATLFILIGCLAAVLSPSQDTHVRETRRMSPARLHRRMSAVGD